MNKFKLIAIAITVSTLLFSCKTENEKSKVVSNNFTVEGTVDGLENNTIYYRIPGKDYAALGYRFDSIVTTNGKFSFTDSIKDYALLRLSLRMPKLTKTTKSGGYYPTNSSYFNVMVYPGASIEIKGNLNADFVDAYPYDGSVNDDFAKIHKLAFPVMNEAVNYLVKSSYSDDKLEKENLIKASDSIDNIANKIKTDFVKNNPKSLAALYYLSDMMMRSQISDEDAMVAFQNVGPSLHDVSFYKEIAQRVTAITTTKVGALAPNIKTTSTLDGKEFDLTSFRGKYVMIDFWGIWCGPCVSEMPKVKEFSEKHSDKLAILGINSGDKKERIINFVTSRDYKWQQLLDVRGSETDNFVLQYNVNAFPTKFIIDPQGKIVKKFVGSGEEAFELLEELLK